MRLPKTGTIEIAPSILASDFSKLGQEIDEVKSAGAKILHLDVMDGHFVPNLTIGPPLISSIRKTTDMVFDAHLMITNPEKYIESFAKAGVDNITFHIEVTDNPIAIVEKLHDMGCSAGICLNPETPVEAIEPVVKYFDMVLVMTVHPGFGGQKFIPEAAEKIIKVREFAGPDIRVEVDGGIDEITTPVVVSYGADTLVAGNAIFGQNDRKAAIDAILNSYK